MKLYIALLFFATTVFGQDWEGYQRAINHFSKLGINNDPAFETSRSADLRVISFPCDVKALTASPSNPTSVHKLRPTDIKVIGAIGDSLTAANGAKAVLLTSLLTEYRGISWSMGGDGDSTTATTLPNLFRKFNPTLKGFSLGTGSYTSSGANFNVAQPGHTSHEMLAQAKLLVSRIQADKYVNFNEDWKVITFFVGGNDLCKFCQDELKYQPDRFAINIRDTLDYFQANLPRTLVNMVETLDVRGIETLNTGFVCNTMHGYLCDCGITVANADKLNALVDGYQALTKQLVNSGRYDKDPQFTVVLQPFMEQMAPPTLANGNADYSYFAPDCFHFSVKGHETAAMELWNNMFQKVGQKSTKWEQNVSKVNCPTDAAPYIYTNVNSL